MAIEVGEAYVSIIPSARGFSGRLSSLIGPEVAASGGSVGGGFLSSFLGSIAGIGSGILAAIGISKITSEISNGLRSAFSVTAAFETTQVAFTGLLGSAEKANEELAKLQKFAQRTPFEFPELADASRKLLAVGFDSERIIPIMTQLGNAAAAVGAKGYDINLVVRALGQIKGKGRIMGEEINQIAEALPGFNPLKAIAEDTGIAFEELQNNIGKPGGLLKAFGIDGSQAVESILRGMEKIPGAAGAMERQNKTLSGSLSNLKDQLKQTAIATLLPFFPGIADFILNTVVPWVARIGEDLPAAAQRAVGWLRTLRDGFLEFFNAFRTGQTQDEGTLLERVALRLRDGWDTIKTIFAEVKQGFSEFFKTLFSGQTENDVPTVAERIALAILSIKDSIVAVVQFVKDNRDWIEPMLAGLAALAATIYAIVQAQKALTAAKGLAQLVPQVASLLLAAGPIGLLAGLLVAVGVAGFIAYQKFEPFRNVVDTVARFIRDVAVSAFEGFIGVVQRLSGVFDSVSNAVGTAVGAIQTAWATIQVVFAVAVAGILTVLTPLANWFQEHLFPAVSAAVEFFVAWGTLVFNTISNTVSTVISILEPFVATFINIIQIWFTIVSGLWEQAWNAILTGFQTFVSIAGPIWSVFWENLKVVAETIFNLVRIGIETVLGIIQGIFTAATGLITGDWGKFWDGIKTVAETIFGHAKEAIQTVINAIKGIFENDLGAITGIIDGIFGGVRSLIDGFVGALESAADTIAGVVGRIKDAISSIPGAGVVGNILGKIPGLAAGGLVTRPTLAVVGEAGPEAVIPLSMFNEGVQFGRYPQLAQAAMGGADYATSGMTVVINAPLGVDRREVVDAVAEGIRRADTARRGTF